MLKQREISDDEKYTIWGDKSMPSRAQLIGSPFKCFILLFITRNLITMETL